MSQQTPAVVPIFTPKAPSCGPKPVDAVYKWVNGLLLQYENTSFSVGSVIDKEQSMYHDAPTPDNDESYKSRFTFCIRVTYWRVKVADEPLATPLIQQVMALILYHCLLCTLHCPYCKITMGSTFPMFNGSVNKWNCFKISLCSYFYITGMNMNLISLNNSSTTDEEKAIFWTFFKQSFWNSPIKKYVHLFIDGISLFKHLNKVFKKYGLDKV